MCDNRDNTHDPEPGIRDVGCSCHCPSGHAGTPAVQCDPGSGIPGSGRKRGKGEGEGVGVMRTGGGAREGGWGGG